MFAKVFELVDILNSTLTCSDLIKNLKQTLGTYTAGSALTAGFFNGELKEEFSHVNHAGVFVHNDKTA